jgi:formylmethanofuran dehydrogenase subunit C
VVDSAVARGNMAGDSSLAAAAEYSRGRLVVGGQSVVEMVEGVLVVEGAVDDRLMCSSWSTVRVFR